MAEERRGTVTQPCCKSVTAEITVLDLPIRGFLSSPQSRWGPVCQTSPVSKELLRDTEELVDLPAGCAGRGSASVSGSARQPWHSLGHHERAAGFMLPGTHTGHTYALGAH